MTSKRKAEVPSLVNIIDNASKNDLIEISYDLACLVAGEDNEVKALRVIIDMLNVRRATRGEKEFRITPLFEDMMSKREAELQ